MHADISKPHNEDFNFIIFGAVNTFRYTKYKGETEFRRVIPHCIRFGVTEHHKDDGNGGHWLLEAFDCNRNALRTFALKDIHPR